MHSLTENIILTYHKENSADIINFSKLNANGSNNFDRLYKNYDNL